jgi:hypothetical protein
MSIVSNAKEIADIVKKLGDIELYRKIVELEGEIIELTRANHSLEVRVQELTSTLAVSQNLTFKEPFYYAEGDPVPFCPKCWEGERKAIHLVNGGSFEGETKFECVPCKHVYWYKGHHA